MTITSILSQRTLGSPLLSFCILAAIISSSACTKKADPKTSPKAEASVADAPVLADVQLTDLKVGSGALAASGSSVSIHYVGSNLNGSKFFDTHTKNKPQTFKLGSPLVIPGLSAGIVGMKVGGLRRVVIPPAKAYGAKGVGTVVPPGSTLAFDVELLAVK